MVVGIHQPQYFPWMGFFYKMAKSDTFILLDDVQLEKGSYMYRNRIINQYGNTIYLTISGEKKGFLERKYRHICSKNDEVWLTKHQLQIKMAYGLSSNYAIVWDAIEDLFVTQEKSICDYCIRSIYRIKEILGIHTEVIKQSDLDYDTTKQKNDLILNLCKNIGATQYLSGIGAKKYNDEKLFFQENIDLVYTNFIHPSYPQIHTEEFVEGLSILDVLFNCGIEKTKELFWNQVLHS